MCLPHLLTVIANRRSNAAYIYIPKVLGLRKGAAHHDRDLLGRAPVVRVERNEARVGEQHKVAGLVGQSHPHKAAGLAGQRERVDLGASGL
eukprot:scaffold378100_cov50-Prasinocladus_malaysianus.AAC.1